MPDLIKKKVYAEVLSRAHQAGTAAAIPPEQRATLARDIAAKLVEKLQSPKADQ